MNYRRKRGMNALPGGLFDSGLDFQNWTPMDWGMAILGGFTVLTAISALKLSIGRLR